MSDSDKKIQRALTDNFLTKKFNTDIGQKATVQRQDFANELSTKANAALRGIGESVNPVAGSLTYMGSAAVHIYQSEMLGQIFFMSQAQTLGQTDEALASKALNDLRGAMQEHYGRKRQILRSGF